MAKKAACWKEMARVSANNQADYVAVRVAAASVQGNKHTAIKIISVTSLS